VGEWHSGISTLQFKVHSFYRVDSIATHNNNTNKLEPSVQRYMKNEPGLDDLGAGLLVQTPLVIASKQYFGSRECARGILSIECVQLLILFVIRLGRV